MYIPQYTDKIASLNVAIAGSIIFQHFAIWAGFQSQKIVGYKFEEGEYETRMKGVQISTEGRAVLNDPVKKREDRENRRNNTDFEGELGLDIE